MRTKEVSLGMYRTEQQAHAAIAGAECVANEVGHIVASYQVFEHKVDKFDKVEVSFVAKVFIEKLIKQ